MQQLTRFAAIAALCATACTTATSSGPDGAGGSGTGVGGAQGSGGRTGAGGSNGGGTGGTGGMTGGGSGGQGGTPAGSGGTGGAGGAVARACPTDATFCSGFEEAGMPAGAVYKANAAPGDWTRDFALDTTLHNSGAASLRVKSSMDAGTSGSAYKMLAVPAPSGKFWVRFYVRSELDMGSVDHNAFVEAAGSDDPNDGVFLELAEDAGIAFNSHDDVRWPATYGRLTTGTVNPFVLPKAVWHCVEISFDSTARAQMLFLNGTQQINVTDYPSAAQLARPFTVFRFGFSQLHGPPRQMWYDDVAVGPNRMPCF